MIQRNLKGLEKMEVSDTSHKKVFLGNEYISYIHTPRNAEVTFTRDFYEKIVMKWKKEGFQRRI